MIETSFDKINQREESEMKLLMQVEIEKHEEAERKEARARDH